MRFAVTADKNDWEGLLAEVEDTIYYKTDLEGQFKSLAEYELQFDLDEKEKETELTDPRHPNFRKDESVAYA